MISGGKRNPAKAELSTAPVERGRRVVIPTPSPTGATLRQPNGASRRCCRLGPALGDNERVDWLFRNRQTGEITIGQVPNLPLVVFAVALAVRWIFSPSGTVGALVAFVGTIALIWWALDELVRGVNPWRRILGGTVLVIQLAALLGP